MKKNTRYWFWAWLTQITLHKRNRSNRKAQRGEVWRNLVLLSARNAGEAIAKARRLGSGLEGDSHGSLTLDGHPAYTKLVGIEEMGLVHDLVDGELADGLEILFTAKRTSLAAARKRLRGDKLIVESLRCELQPYLRLRKARKADLMMSRRDS